MEDFFAGGAHAAGGRGGLTGGGTLRICAASMQEQGLRTWCLSCAGRRHDIAVREYGRTVAWYERPYSAWRWSSTGAGWRWLRPLRVQL